MKLEVRLTHETKIVDVPELYELYFDGKARIMPLGVAHIPPSAIVADLCDTYPNDVISFKVIDENISH